MGKLEASLSLVFLLAFSALPSMGMVMIFGGVGYKDLFLEVIFLVVSGIFIGSIGIFCSSFCQKTNMATILSYLFTILLVVGTLAALVLFYFIQVIRMENSGSYYEITIGPLIYLLLLNPLIPYYGLLTGQLGNGFELQEIAGAFGDYGNSWGVDHMIGLGIAAQLFLSLLLLVAAARGLMRRR